MRYCFLVFAVCQKGLVSDFVLIDRVNLNAASTYFDVAGSATEACGMTPNSGAPGNNTLGVSAQVTYVVVCMSD